MVEIVNVQWGSGYAVVDVNGSFRVELKEKKRALEKGWNKES